MVKNVFFISVYTSNNFQITYKSLKITYLYKTYNIFFNITYSTLYLNNLDYIYT